MSSPLTTDDLMPLPHIVIIVTEDPARLTIAEFERGAEGQRTAYEYAESQVGHPGVARVLVTVRCRSLGTAKALMGQPE